MNARIGIAIILFVVVLAAGVGISAVGVVRQRAALTQCQNNLRFLGVALQAYHDNRRQFPAGTVLNPDLPPERRLSWTTEVWPAYLEAGSQALFDREKAWDAEANCPPRGRVVDCSDGLSVLWEGQLNRPEVFLCPANTAQGEPRLPEPLSYLGVGGLGEAAAALPLSDARAGFFGYDRKLTVADVKDGLATTMALAEAVDGGPWTAGGPATVRGLNKERVPYLGDGGQFASNHPQGTNVLFADGSVRPLTSSLSPQVFEALATVAGGEKVAPLAP